MRWLDEVPRLWRYVLWSALALLASAVLRCGTRSDAVHNPTVFIHIKYRPGAVHAAAAVPLFSRMHATTAAYDDPRDRWFLIEVPAYRAHDVVAELDRDPAVETAFVRPEVSLPHDTGVPHHAHETSCPITTPSFESYQGYLGPAPHGIDAPAAWRRGVRGQGVWFADIEGGWNTKHEDLPGDRITHAGAATSTMRIGGRMAPRC